MNAQELDVVQVAAYHARQLRTWVGAPDAPVMAENASQTQMLAALRAAEIELLTTFALVPDEEKATHPICGVWTLNNVAGHLADWDRYFSYWLGLLQGGAPQALYWNEDGDAFNAYWVAQRAGLRWAENWAACRQRRSELYHAFAQVPPEEFVRVLPRNPHVAYPTIYHCAWSALEHYLDHAAGVRRALGLTLPPELLHFQGPYT